MSLPALLRDGSVAPHVLPPGDAAQQFPVHDLAFETGNLHRLPS